MKQRVGNTWRSWIPVIFSLWIAVPGEATIVWTQLPPAPLGSDYFESAIEYNGEIFHLPDFAEKYEPATGTWTLLTRLPFLPEYPAIAQMGAFVYVVGCDQAFAWSLSGEGGFQSNVWTYSLTSDSWWPTAQVPDQFRPTAAAAVAGLIYAFTNPTLEISATGWNLVKVLDPASGAWSDRGPRPLTLWAAHAVAINNTLVLIGPGLITATVASGSTAVQLYDPLSDSWSTGASAPLPWGSGDVATFAGEIYFVGGGDTGGSGLEVEVYNPVTDSWRIETPMPFRGGPTVGIVGCDLYLIGDYWSGIGNVIPNGPVVPNSTTVFRGEIVGVPGLTVGGTVPAKVSVGQAFPASVTGHNAVCSRSVTGAMAAVLFAGPGGAELLSGANPAGPAEIWGGGSSVFLWTLSATGPGLLSITATLTGFDAGSASAYSVATVKPILIQEPARLSATPFVSGGGCVGYPLTISAVIQNVGEASASMIIGSATPSVSGSAGLVKIGGPVPSSEPLLTGGSITFLSWTYSVTAPGSAWFTFTISGSDANAGWLVTTGPVTSTTVVLAPAAVLSATVSTTATGPVPVGSWFTVSLTVTNTGGTGIPFGSPLMIKSPGGQPVIQISGPSAAAPLPPGGSTTFVWTYSVNGGGRVTFNASVSGSDPCHSLGAGGAVTVDLGLPAALAMSVLTATPAVTCAGGPVTVVATVTNTGEVAAAVTGLPLMASGASPLSLPLTLTSLAGGTSTRLTWVYSATATGSLVFSGSVSGIDLRAVSALMAGPSVSNPVTVTQLAVLSVLASSELSGTLVEGQQTDLWLTVTNTGMNDATGVVPGWFEAVGGGAVTMLTGPVPPGPVILAPGGSQTFGWTFSVSGSGAIGLSLSVSGASCGSSPVGGIATVGLTVRRPAALSAVSLGLSPGSLPAGSTAFAAFTIRNTGEVSFTVTQIGRSVPGGVLFPSVDVLPLPLTLSPGGQATVGWGHLSRTFCGTGSILATVAGYEDVTGGWQSASRASNLVTVTTGPSGFSLRASPPGVAVNGSTAVFATVLDACGGLLAGVPVSFALLQGDGWLSAMNAMTDGAGRAGVTLTAGSTSGTLTIWAGLASGLGLSGTLFVAVTDPLNLTDPGAALSRNVLDPSRGESVVARIRRKTSGPVLVRIFTSSGRLVRTLRESRETGGGMLEVVWDGRTEDERPVARGVYLVEVSGGGIRDVLKVVVRPGPNP